ncbi:MAG: hypothetical protein K2N53_06180 [Clostridia bacterium]|nr:hypothetical protein [Clostridia bacterium]MDE7349233.1 hypothetical protein [Clostridia bacterium]
MKKYAKIITAILLVSLLCVALFACVNPDSDKEGTMTLVVIDGDKVDEYVVDLAKIPSGNTQTGLMAILDYLKENGKLTYTAQDSAYGAYLTQINSIVPQGNEFIALYTSIAKDMSVGAYATTITYKGASCTTSDFGASAMSILAGCTIIITRGTY